jgi:putative oxidoreductase
MVDYNLYDVILVVVHVIVWFPFTFVWKGTRLMALTLSLGLLILRLVAGLTIAAHGSQKLLGWFGGGGLAGTIRMQEGLGLKPTRLWGALIILGEFCGGLSLAFGLLTPLGAAGIVGAMFMAIATSHWKNGFFNSNRGFEFPLLMLSVAVAIGIIGPGTFALDALLGIGGPGALIVFIVFLVLAIIVDLIGLYMIGLLTPGKVSSQSSS